MSIEINVKNGVTSVGKENYRYNDNGNAVKDGYGDYTFNTVYKCVEDEGYYGSCAK